MLGIGESRPFNAASGEIIPELPPPKISRILPIMRRAIGCLVGLLLLLMLLLVGKFVTLVAKVFVGVVNALVLIMRASDNVRDIGAIVWSLLLLYSSCVFTSLQWNMMLLEHKNMSE